QQRGEDGAHVDDEHHRVPHLTLRRQLAEGIDRRLAQDGQVEKRTRHRAGHDYPRRGAPPPFRTSPRIALRGPSPCSKRNNGPLSISIDVMGAFLPHRAAIRFRCSTTGPSASAGRKVRAPTRITTPISRPTKSGVSVGSVPGPVGTVFFRATEP